LHWLDFFHKSCRVMSLLQSFSWSSAEDCCMLKALHKWCPVRYTTTCAGNSCTKVIRKRHQWKWKNFITRCLMHVLQYPYRTSCLVSWSGNKTNFCPPKWQLFLMMSYTRSVATVILQLMSVTKVHLLILSLNDWSGRYGNAAAANAHTSSGGADEGREPQTWVPAGRPHALGGAGPHAACQHGLRWESGKQEVGVVFLYALIIILYLSG